jgi:hypothetical protein
MVDKHVYFLMKKRLSTTVDQEPPIFPWETEVTDYVEEPSGDLAADRTNQDSAGNNKEAPSLLPPSSP